MACCNLLIGRLLPQLAPFTHNFPFPNSPAPQQTPFAFRRRHSFRSFECYIQASLPSLESGLRKARRSGRFRRAAPLLYTIQRQPTTETTRTSQIWLTPAPLLPLGLLRTINTNKIEAAANEVVGEETELLGAAGEEAMALELHHSKADEAKDGAVTTPILLSKTVLPLHQLHAKLS